MSVSDLEAAMEEVIEELKAAISELSSLKGDLDGGSDYIPLRSREDPSRSKRHKPFMDFGWFFFNGDWAPDPTKLIATTGEDNG